jgi:hypothetical protein
MIDPSCPTLRAAIVAGLLALAPSTAPARDAERMPFSAGEPDKTGKERLGDKGSDEQRLDNCNVPPVRHGAKARPTLCNDNRP